MIAATCLALGMVFALPHAALAQQPANGKQDIERVIEVFRTSIINKDKDAFMKLFLREDITWVGVTTDASIEMLYAGRKDASLPRPKKYFSSNPRSFIENIAKADGRREETFENVRIDTDGDVAQVWFDYSFKTGGHKQNWGKEAWHLVRAEDGWKITSVIWSMEFNPQPPPAG
jgi:ketosteroid isomerase-like protein